MDVFTVLLACATVIERLNVSVPQPETRCEYLGVFSDATEIL